MVRPSPVPSAVRAERGLVARRLVLGLAVGAAADLDVEHVDLAVDRAVLAVRADVHAGVRAAVGAGDRLGDRAGDEVDAELARRRRAPRSSDGPSSGSAPAAVCSGVPSTGHFSGSTTSSAPRAAASRVSRSAASRLRSRSGVELSWTAAARIRGSCQIDWSVNGAPPSRWTWVGAFGPDVMLCAAAARVGPVRSAWWAVWDGARLHERTYRRLGPVTATPERVAVRGVLDLSVATGTPWECTTGPIWTRKSPCVCAGRCSAARSSCAGWSTSPVAGTRGRPRGGGRAGVGETGRRPRGHVEPRRRAARRRGRDRERCVWVDGEPAHVPPQPFRGFDGVGGLAFEAVATRARREDYGVLMSDYEAPFGRFAGSLPVAGEVRCGWGVMERHSARW